MAGPEQKAIAKHRPGAVRDAIVQVLTGRPEGASVKEIEYEVVQRIGLVPASSIRSYLRLNTPEMFLRMERAQYTLNLEEASQPRKAEEARPARFRSVAYGSSVLFHADCRDWLNAQPDNSVHAVVTDPPYGLVEYSPEQQEKLRNGKGGIWRIPPSFDGVKRAPLPRFTVLTQSDLQQLDELFFFWARAMLRVLVPGANVVIASNPLLSHVVSNAVARAGLERRGEIIRLVMTMRGGDRPKAAHEEFPGVSVIPRSMWEPWLTFRRPVEGRVQDNLRKCKTGAFRRP